MSDKTPESRRNYRKWLICAGIIVISFLAGWYAHILFNKPPQKAISIRENSPQYQFINPLILTDNSNTTYPQYDPLKKTIADYISKAEANGQAKDVSVYFRDMNSGAWTGVNENDLYAPSSMLKVGILMSYLNIFETDPDVFNEELYYTPTNDSGQFYKPAQVLSAGNHTVEQLLQQMIIYSDNDALTALDNAHPKELVSVFDALGIPYPSVSSPKDFMSPLSYSRLFRVLYNSTYLPDDFSEQALKLLTVTDFNDGLVSGVTASTTVAHKFGEQTETDLSGATTDELHDCGIIYYPGDPYFLCVMTKGSDFPTLATIISDISKIVFDNEKKILPQ